MANDINGYVLSRAWFDFVADNHGKVKPVHSALFFWVCEVWNRLSQPKEFGLPAKEAMHYMGIGRHEAFSNALKDLTDWGFIVIKQASINQYKANIISICPPQNAQGTDYDTAQSKRKSTAQGTAHGNANVIEPKNIETNKPLNNITDINGLFELKVLTYQQFELLLNETSLEQDVKNALLEFYKHRQIVKTPVSGLAAKKLFNKIEHWLKTFTTHEVILSIDASISSGKWTDIYEPKRKQQQTTQPPATFSRALRNSQLKNNGQ